MDLIKHTAQWVNGEVLQGKIGLCTGIIIAISFFYFANFQYSFYKGMIIPFILLQVVLLGYSSFQMVMRPKHIEKVEQYFTVSREKAIHAEFEKSQKEDKVYSKLRLVWAGLFVEIGRASCRERV